MPRFAANLSTLFRERPFPERFAAAAAAGFEAVEFQFPYPYPADEVARWIQSAGLGVVLFNLPAGDWAAGERGLTSLPGREVDFRQGLDRALEYARALGVRTLHAMAGVLPPGADRAAYLDVYVENLRVAAGVLADEGMRLTIEPINPRDMPGYLLNSQHEGHAIRERVGAPNLFVQMDCYHAQIVDGDLATTIRRHITHIGHVQIAGVPERREPDQGEVHYPYLLRLLDDLSYDGWIGCEYCPKGRTEDGLAWFRRWQRTALEESGA